MQSKPVISQPTASDKLLCLSLPYIKTPQELQEKQKQIIEKSANPNYLPLSLVELELLTQK